MDHGTKYWFTQSYEKQCEDIHFEFYSLFHYCRDMNDHNVKLYMNRCIKYTQFSIDDPKNADRVDVLTEILGLEKEFKTNPSDMQIAKKIDDFFCTDNTRKVFEPKRKKDETDRSELLNLLKEINDSFPQSRISIIQYDVNDYPIRTYTGTFNEVFDSIENPSSFYYRIAAFDQTISRKRISDVWFGIKTSCLGGLSFDIGETLNRYLNYLVKRYEKGEHCNFYDILCHFQWYAKAIANYNTLKPELLQDQLDLITAKYPKLKKVSDLNEYREKKGIYILVLDKYNSCYIGQAENITQRIMRHWSRSDYHTGTGIDMFKAYDTTRIYVLECESKEMDKLEHDLIALANPDVTINILSGGDLGYIIENNKPILKEQKYQSINDFIGELVVDYMDAESLEPYFIVESTS